MDIDFDTLIYLIVTIILIAVGAIGKKKKPGIPVSDVETTDETDMGTKLFGEQFKSVFENYAEEKRQYQEDRFYDPEKTESRVSAELGDLLESQREDQLIEVAAESYDNRIDSMKGMLDTYEGEGASAIPGTEDIHDIIKFTELGSANEQPLDDSDIVAILEEFNGRKAVVYSEIINPKYF
jgi:hypothetical protein